MLATLNSWASENLRTKVLPGRFLQAKTDVLLGALLWLVAGGVVLFLLFFSFHSTFYFFFVCVCDLCMFVFAVFVLCCLLVLS